MDFNAVKIEYEIFFILSTLLNIIVPNVTMSNVIGWKQKKNFFFIKIVFS